MAHVTPPNPSEPAPITLARNAMATRFEMVLHGHRPAQLRAAGEAALDEIERLDAWLSFYSPTSQISQINAQAARKPVKVDPELFHLIRRSLELSAATDGAFDITVAPLMKVWGFVQGTGRRPSRAELENAMASIGSCHIELDESTFSIRFKTPGLLIDLGSVGKGYAIDRAVEILMEAGVESALIHGGTSSVYGLGAPPGESHWKIAIENPVPPRLIGSCSGAPLAVVPLKNEALSVSAPSGKSFESDGVAYGHVINPRSGRPTQNALLAGVVLASTAETDALSTALLVLGREGNSRILAFRPAARHFLLLPGEGGDAGVLESTGFSWE